MPGHWQKKPDRDPKAALSSSTLPEMFAQGCKAYCPIRHLLHASRLADCGPCESYVIQSMKQINSNLFQSYKAQIWDMQAAHLKLLQILASCAGGKQAAWHTWMRLLAHLRDCSSDLVNHATIMTNSCACTAVVHVPHNQDTGLS